MSLQPLSSAGNEITAGAVGAAERVARLRALIAEVDGGPASFAATLQGAISSGANAATATTPQASAASLTSPGSSQYSSYQPLTGETPSGGESGGGGYSSLIAAAAARNGIDPAVLHGLIQQESGFDPSSHSGAGAEGLTQLMPETAASLGVADPLNPAESIEGGARYLGSMLRQFGGNVEDALAAYNAGPGAVQQYGGVPPYAETQQYVSKVLGYAAEYGQAQGARTTVGTAA
jgi:soluble lytic murein transglycosylase-like protein